MLSAFGIMLILKHIECQTILFRRLSARLSAVSTAKMPACRKGCPIANDIPDWIGELAKGNFGNAMKIINTRSNLPCCPRPRLLT